MGALAFASSGDAAQDYLDSGGTTRNPLAASDSAQAYLESGGKTAHPLKGGGNTSAPIVSSGDPAQDYLDSGGTTANPVTSKPNGQVTYDAAEFKRRVGRAPENSVELANFAATKGRGWAGDPNAGKYSASEAAVGAAEDVASVGTGIIASIPAGLTYIGKLGLTLDPEAAAAASDAVQNALTYRPRTEAGGEGLQEAGAAPRSIGEGITQGLDKLDPTGNLSETAGEIGGGIQRAAGALPVAGEVVALSRGAGLTRSALGAARNAAGAARTAVAEDVASGTYKGAPAGTEYSPEGVAVTPKAAPAAVSPAANTIGASAEAPPKFETAPAPGAPTPKSETAPPSAAPVSPATLPAEQQAQRAATLRTLGLQDSDLRESAVTGDKKAAATDFQQSKLDTEGGQKAAALLGREREALGNYSDQLVADAGGTAGLDETSLHNRGSTILQPLQDLSDHFDAKISELYQRADAAAKGQPLDLTNTAKALGNRSEFIGTTDGQQLLRGVNAYLREAGIADDAGTLGNATVEQAERLKQYLNRQWTPQNGRLIRSLKDAVDDDVTGSAGSDIYAEARAARAARANLLDNPKGISSLLEESGPGGINRKVNVEKVPDALTRMPVDQFGHVIDTLHRMPAEMQPQAQTALGEIRSQLMLRMQEKAQAAKGAWSNRAVTQYLNANSAKLAKVFSPAELERMRVLNDAGNILDIDRSYPGAAVQGANLATRMTVGAVKHGVAAAAHTLGPLAPVAVEAIGGKIENAIAGAAARKGPRIWKAPS